MNLIETLIEIVTTLIENPRALCIAACAAMAAPVHADDSLGQGDTAARNPEAIGARMRAQMRSARDAFAPGQQAAPAPAPVQLDEQLLRRAHALGVPIDINLCPTVIDHRSQGSRVQTACFVQGIGR